MRTKDDDRYDLNVQVEHQTIRLPAVARTLLAFILSWCSVGSGPAFAQDARSPETPYPQPYPVKAPAVGYHQHDGFFLHMHLGVGGLRAVSEELKQRWSGMGIGLGFALGRAVSRHLVVFGELEIVSVYRPDVYLDGQKIGTFQNSMDSFGMGPGARYYFGESNAFVSATLQFAQLSLSDDDGDDAASTEIGAGLSVKAGKEWWVSSDWSLGILLGLQLSTAKDDSPGKERWNTTAGFASLSATYN